MRVAQVVNNSQSQAYIFPGRSHTGGPLRGVSGHGGVVIFQLRCSLFFKFFFSFFNFRDLFIFTLSIFVNLFMGFIYTDLWWVPPGIFSWWAFQSCRFFSFPLFLLLLLPLSRLPNPNPSKSIAICIPVSDLESRSALRSRSQSCCRSIRVQLVWFSSSLLIWECLDSGMDLLIDCLLYLLVLVRNEGKVSSFFFFLIWSVVFWGFWFILVYMCSYRSVFLSHLVGC